MTEPRFAYATAELAIVARYLRNTRASGDPAQVEAGRMKASQAADRLRIAEAIDADWSGFSRGEVPDGNNGATNAEKLASLREALVGAVARRDGAWRSLGEWPWLHQMSLAELWALDDAHDPRAHHIGPYLHWESYTAAIEALIWWHDPTVPRVSKREIVAMNQMFRGVAAGQRAAA